MTAATRTAACPSWCTIDHSRYECHQSEAFETQLVRVSLSQASRKTYVLVQNLRPVGAGTPEREIFSLHVEALPAFTALMDTVGRRDVGTLLRQASDLLAAETARPASEAA